MRKIILDAEVEKVWTFVTAPENFPKYVYGYVDGKTTSASGTGVGAGYEWYGKLGPWKVKSVEEIVHWRENRDVAYRGRLFGIKFYSSITLRKLKERTEIKIVISYRVPLYFGGAIGDFFFIKWIVKESIRKSIRNLKKIFPDANSITRENFK